MAEKIVLRLNQMQQKKIKQKLGKVCDTVEIEKDELVNILKYMPPQICIDFDDEQEKIIKKAFPGKECDYAIIDIKDLGNVLRYMPPPSGKSKK